MEIFQERYSSEKKNRYISSEKLGEGTFGEVRKATDVFNGKTVAVKYIRIMSRNNGIPKAVFRELESLRQLSECRHIVRLLDVFTDETKLCLVMEYVQSDLYEVINNSTEYMPRAHIKAYSLMIMKALSHCHENKIVHRDIKPANLLLTSGGVVKLADFGLARICDVSQEGGVQSMSHQVATRQYRAPELLFATRHYDFAVDVWSAAVIIVELITRLALFPGTGDLDQMHRVFQVMGTPSVDNWPGVDQLPDFCKVSFPDKSPVDLRLVAPNAHREELDFIRLMLQLDPKKRISSTEAVKLSYFKEDPLPAECCELIVPRRATNSKPKREKPIESLEEFEKAVDDMFSY